jgi:ribonuclease G
VAQTLYIQHAPEETRVAVQEDGRVVEVEVERAYRRALSGNIYRGRVAEIAAHMDAAFIDIGLERKALLHASDVWHAGLAEPARPNAADGAPNRRRHKPIGSIVQPGQEIMVQVVREPAAKKGPRVTMFISLPGRNLVYLPRDNHIGVSRALDDPAERTRLLDLVVSTGLTGGAIVRTAGEGASEAELRRDIDKLRERWRDIQTRYDCASAPSYLYDDYDLVLRALRDRVCADTSLIWLDNAAELPRVEAFLAQMHPELHPQIRTHPVPGTLFAEHGVDRAVRAALDSRVELKSGGYLVIERTEAGTVIDVNSGGQPRAGRLADMILRLNLEAARAIARELRLRNIGGLVFIDFVDMRRKDDRRMLEAVFNDELAPEGARVQVGRLNRFGVLIMTRRRSGESLETRLMERCPTCQGTGAVRSASDIAVEELGKLRRILTSDDRSGGKVALRVPARALPILDGELRGVVDDLAARHGVTIAFEASPA